MTMVVMSVIVAGLVTYALVNNRSTMAYATQREERYAGDAAIKAGINWAQDQPTVGRDPLLAATDPPCVYQVPTEVGVVTASCAAEAGSGSGNPAEEGLLPPESMLVLGTRKTTASDPSAGSGDEPGPYNVPDCKGWWDTFTGWFQSGINPDSTGPGEWGMWFRGRKGLGTLSATCEQDRSRTRSNFKVEGDLVAAGRIQVSDGGAVTVLNGSARARHGCSGGGLSCSAPGTRSGFTGDLAYLNGTPRDSDPGRTNPSSPAQNPTDIASAWLAAGFNADGSVAPLGYAPTSLMPSAMPERTTAYVWNSATGALTASAGCAGSAATMVFLPGWYRQADVLNKYTANGSSSCKDVTFWFAPDPGPDGRLLTADDRTGAYYFDFRSGAGQACTGMPANSARWCVGASPDQNARIVAGTPLGWAPLGSAPIAGGGPDPRPRTQVTVGTAETIDEDLSQSWANASRARAIDGQAAHYKADVCVFVCFSSDRAIRLRDFSPDVTAPPIDEVGAPKGRIYVDVAYSVTNPTAADYARLEVRAVSPQSGDKACGTYPLFTDKAAADAATGLHTYTFTAAQAKQLADACGTVDLINGLELTLKVTGNGTNSPHTEVNLDGMRIRYDSFEGANFPNPQGGSSTPQAAKSDCDPAKAGAQLIFGGASHAYVGDGSLEVCAGGYPTNPENHQAIGIYGVPAVAEILPTSITGHGGTNNVDSPSNPGSATALDRNVVTINYGGCAAYCGRDFEEGWVNLRMGSYSPPAGYQIARVEARVAYNPKSQNCSALWDCPGRAPQLQFPSGACSGIDFPKNPDRGPLQVANLDAALLYDVSGSRTCVTPAQLAAGATLRWAARAECTYTFVLGDVCKAGGGQWHDELDGLALQITLQPIATGTARLIPQSGCITAHPNYNGGSGNPDCAIVRADTSDFADNWSLPWAAKEGQSRGRLSVKGTIYAPSSALEVDDTDAAYPLATRGLVLRHLRMSGWGFRSGYDGTAVGNTVDKTPAAREVTFLACVQSAARRTARAACDAGAGDRILSRARVRFGVRPASAPTSPGTASVPLVQWFVNDR